MLKTLYYIGYIDGKVIGTAGTDKHRPDNSGTQQQQQQQEVQEEELILYSIRMLI